MLPPADDGTWMEPCRDDEPVSVTNNNGDHDINASLYTFKSMLDPDWYLTQNSLQPHLHSFPNHQHEDINNLLLQAPLDSSSSCSPSPAFTLDPSSQSFFPLNSCSSSLFYANPFDNNSFDLGSNANFLFNQSSNSHVSMGFNGMHSNLLAQFGIPELSSSSDFAASRLNSACMNSNAIGGGGSGSGFFPIGYEGFQASANIALLPNRSKVLRPLEISAPLGAQPTLFQKRAALRRSSDTLGIGNWGNVDNADEIDGKRKRYDEFDGEEGTMGLSGLNYDSEDELVSENANNDGGNGDNSNAINSCLTSGGQKGKKKGIPAKNLMAERRRRKKLNDRLYMLRSVVPKISKMDRASILGDAIGYLKDLLQRINDLHNELETTPQGSSVPTSSSFHPLTPTPTPPTLPHHIKEELSVTTLPSPKNHPARVEVRAREGRAVTIHMFCGRRPNLLHSTLKALDRLGLDIQQAVISCFNGFALDIFRAEQCQQEVVAEEKIKAVLVELAGCSLG